MADDIVKFLMPDGTEVSNDPSFDLDGALVESLKKTKQRGSEGPTWDEQQAQTQTQGRPEETTGDPTKDLHGVLGSPAQRVQKEDVQEAQAAGASPKSTSVEDPAPVDSNQEVLKVRESLAADQELARKTAEKLGEDGPGDTEKPYSEWTGKQLVAEVARRNADEDRTEEDRIEVKKGSRKADVAALLEADDERQASADELDNDAAGDDSDDD